ncbi:unnamed protein product, partial [Oncorhynchus mykiss]
HNMTVHDTYRAKNKIQSINQSNCSFLNTKESMTPVFNNLAFSDFSFGEITHIEEGALAWLQNLTMLTGVFSQEVLLDLPLSGIKQIQDFSCSGINVIDIESICNVVFLLSIKKIYVNNANTSSLSMSSVELCTGLEYMYLSGLGSVHPSPHLEWNFISSLKNLNQLKIVGLEDNRLDICSFQKQPITWLTKFTLGLKNLMPFAKQFICLVKLQYLDLTQNLISNIEDFAFLGLTNLESLDITSNNITQINANTFYGLHSLTWLDLRNNPLIHNIEAMSFTHLMSLRQVFLGQVHNPLTEPVIKLNLTLIFVGILSQLTHLYISSAMRPMQLTIGTKRVDLTSINQLIHLRKLTLRQVDLLIQRSADIIFHNLTKLEDLEIYHCRIYSLEGSLTKDLKSLKRVYLHIENIYNLY